MHINLAKFANFKRKSDHIFNIKKFKKENLDIKNMVSWEFLCL